MWRHNFPEGRLLDRQRWHSAEHYATRGAYDIYDLLWRHYKPATGDVVIDVGAGNGGETLFLAGMVGKEGRVVAIEPADVPFERLVAMCALNRWSHVEPHKVALSATSGTVSISESESWVSSNIYEGGTSEVRSTTLDDLCDQLGITSVNWLKMNIEGAEKEAIQGMERMAPNVKNMTISCHDFLGTDWGRSKMVVTKWLKDHGFEVRTHGPGLEAEKDYIYAWRGDRNQVDRDIGPPPLYDFGESEAEC
ncbi:FkbM family methyltransferase [Nostocoides sp. F2B08]|uniref:FkbM family methyltransferase n=1 Tax=Nostocoides sp. F2B08 TaxID=2653936 RepID=UPI001262CAF4|nr:FkbM family methyltransferase [Tetrasphaera sp. F2B08]